MGKLCIYSKFINLCSKFINNLEAISKLIMLYKFKISNFLVFLTFIFAGCGLSPEQELNLSRDITAYIDARNTGDAIEFIGYTYPSVVKHFAQQDSVALIERFQQVPPNFNHSADRDSIFYWNNYYIKSVSKRGAFVEVNLDITSKNSSGEKKSISHIGVSLNEGDNWLFLKAEEADMVKI